MNKKIKDEGIKLSFHILNLTFNLLTNMEEKKINTKFIKTKDELNKDENYFFKMLNKKRNYECISEIIDDLKHIKDIIHKNKDIKLEIIAKKGNLPQILNYLTDSEYFCLIKYNNNSIYGIFDKTTYI